jgi:hypothetical protein
MKRILLIALSALFITTIQAQKTNVNASRVTVSDSIWINGKWIKGINTSPSLTGAADNEVPSTKAVKDYVAASGGGATAYFDNITALRASTIYVAAPTVIATTKGYNSIGDGGSADWYYDTLSSATETPFIIKPTAVTGLGRWIKIFKGVVRAKEAGIKTDGTDQTASLNSLFLNNSVKDVLFDDGDVTINGKVNAQGKKIVFQNTGKIKGVAGNSDTLTNAFIDADYTQQIFDTTLTVTNLNEKNRRVSLLWFGAKPDYVNNTTRGTDNLTAFNKAKAALINSEPSNPYYALRGTLYIPEGKYYFSNTLVVDATIKVQGSDGDYRIWGTRLFFPNTVTGMKLVPPNAGSGIYGGMGIVIERLEINVTGPVGTNWHIHGIDCQAVATMRSVGINGFSGNGINVAADVNNGTQNSSETLIERCYTSFNRGAGLWMTGGDANIIRVSSFEAIMNGSKGIAETAFLGNHLEDCHIAYTGAIDNSPIYCSVGAKSYICFKDSTVNVKPTVTANWQNYWYEGTIVGATATPYDSTKQYMAGAPYYITGINAPTVLVDCYSESGQPLNISGPRTMVIGGTQGVEWLHRPDLGFFDMRLGTSDGSYDSKAPFMVRIPQAPHNIYLNNLGIGVVSTHEPSSQGLYYTFDEYYKAYTYRYANSQAKQPIMFPTDSTLPSFYGRSVAFQTGLATMQPNPLLGIEGTASFRLYKFATAKPTSGNWADGDYLKYQGTDSTIAGFRCIVAGTPGTWITERTGNGITGGGGSTSPGGATTQLQYNNAGAFAGSANLTWNNTTNVLAATNVNTTGYINTPDMRILGSTMFDVVGGTTFRINAGGYSAVGIMGQVIAGTTTSAGTRYKLQTNSNLYIGGDMTFSAQASSPPTPSTGLAVLGAKSDGTLHYVIPGGTDYNLTQNITSFIAVNDADYTVGAGITDVVYHTMTAGRTVTLPAAAGSTNRKITIRNGGNGAFSITLSVAVKSNATTTISTLAASEWVTIVSDGTDWWVVSAKP